ncbi:hypothetical protein OUZ56_023149 [Daphnia magna]|uniref:AIG1-type G domain-containing protein n=2 Tax=Daphnia magna TaxID=35525 RepID=A0ABR0AYF5_9CRUS|nr:hypothetical protein OUZ56_023149 [Daphnia magna]
MLYERLYRWLSSMSHSFGVALHNRDHQLFEKFSLLLQKIIILKVKNSLIKSLPMAGLIRISALGRDAQVGDLYNYLTDVIVPSEIDVPNELKMISETAGKPKGLFIYQQPEKSKRHFLGINSHLLENMKRGSVPGHQLWFADYLNTNTMDGDERHAQVTLLFRAVQRTETLDLHFLRSKIDDYQLRSSATGATHVIDEVVYGAEVICSMRKVLDLSQETKESAEVSIYLAAKEYLDVTILKSFNLLELPVELDQISCTVLSSIESGEKIKMDFNSFNLYLQNLLNTDNNRQKWKPLEFLLRNMSAVHIEAKLWSERKDDVALEKEHHQVTRKWIIKEMRDIFIDPSLQRFPLLEKFIWYFNDLLPRVWDQIEEAYKTFEMLPEERALEEMMYISDWLKEIIDLFAYMRKNIREICWLLKDTDLVLLDRKEIVSQMTKTYCKIAKLFVLNIEYKHLPIVNDLEKFVGQRAPTALLPVLPIFSYEKEQIRCVRTAISEFANVAKLAKSQGSMNGVSYHIGFYSPTLNDAAVVTVDFSNEWRMVISVDNPVEYLKEPRLLARSFSVSSSLPPPLTPTVVSNQNQELKTDKASECINPNTHFAENPTAKLKDNSDVDTRFAATDSTKTKSLMQQSHQSAATAVSLNDQTVVRSKAKRLSLQIGQLNLGDAKAKELWTLVDAQFKKNFNDGRSTAQNSRISKPRSCTNKRYTKTHAISSSEKVWRTRHQERSDEIVDGRGNGKVDEVGEVDPNEDHNYRRTSQRNTELHENRRIAEVYIDEGSLYSKLIRRGPPNIYLLNAIEKSIDNDFKWFDICRPGDPMRSRNPKNHKFIILMGATGSGKSTLINGMINYILEVQWNDPFRFKCVHEDEIAARNQAHSQTSSVTAYTLHHQEGMTIPYSITIIDTPGYGDTGGVEKDKEITAKIHRFLTQQEIPIDGINAACFVAASGDSRLTATQRYIIDSVLSIFGKDMKDNLRLLVTFADNADPPVVGACLSANFPTTSASDGIAYSKFNISVLYCSNAKQGDDEFSFDELFWYMSHENFKKFFFMLETMKSIRAI